MNEIGENSPQTRRLEGLLAPTSIVVVGVSARRENTGTAVIDNLVEMGFSGALAAVGRRQGSRGSVSIADSLESTSGADLAVIAVPSSEVLPCVETGVSLGIKNYVVLTAGFAESDGDGRLAQRRLRHLAQQHDLAVLGPNTWGFINYRHAVNASFAPWWNTGTTAGPAALISQSGGIAQAIVDRAARLGVRFSYVIGSGNEAALDTVDYLDYLIEETAVRHIAVYAEGIRRGREFLDCVVRFQSQGGQVVVMPGGRRSSSARAALSHTASLAPPGEVTRQLLEGAGAVVAGTPQEVAATLALLDTPRPIPSRGNLLIFADSGGTGVHATDLAAEAGIDVPLLPAPVQAQLSSLLPTYGSATNPIDLTPTPDDDDKCRILELALAADNIDAVAYAGVNSFFALNKRLLTVLGASEKYSFAVWLIGMEENEALFRPAGIPYLDDPKIALESWARLVRARRSDLTRTRTALSATIDSQPSPVLEVSGRALVTEAKIESSMQESGVRVAPSQKAQTADEAVAAAEALGFPVVMKALSPAVPHRARIGAISLEVPDAQHVRAEFERIVDAVECAQPGAELDGILVQAQARPGTEVYLGIQVFPGFGPVISIGWGGGLVEAQHEVAFGLIPANESAIEDMIECSALLQAGLSKKEKRAFAKIGAQLSQWWCDNSVALGLLELDVNPVMFDGNGAFVADALAVRATDATT